MRTKTEAKTDYGYTIIETNSENIDPSQPLYNMTYEAFEMYLADLHKAKLAGEI